MYIITLHIDIILKICIIIVLKYREINVGLLIHISAWLIHNMNYQVQFGINISEINVSSMRWSMSLGSQTSISLAPGNIYAFNFGSLSLLCYTQYALEKMNGKSSFTIQEKGHLLYETPAISFQMLYPSNNLKTPCWRVIVMQSVSQWADSQQASRFLALFNLAAFRQQLYSLEAPFWKSIHTLNQ